MNRRRMRECRRRAHRRCPAMLFVGSVTREVFTRQRRVTVALTSRGDCQWRTVCDTYFCHGRPCEVAYRPQAAAADCQSRSILKCAIVRTDYRTLEAPAYGNGCP